MIATRFAEAPLAPRTAGPRACSSRISIFGRAPSGCEALSLSPRSALASGKASATISTGILGASNATVATDAPAPVPRLRWQTVSVESIEPLGRRAKLLHVRVANWPGHLPGQHVDLRLTAADGYQAQRSYSIASAPHEPGLSLAVEHVAGGEVSPYLTTEVRAGDAFELRGPIGGYFVWEAATGGPLYLCAGGSGIAPFMAVLEHRKRVAGGLPTTVLYSVRSPEDAMFAAAHRRACSGRSRVADRVDLHTRGAAGLARLHAADRRGHVTGHRAAAGRSAADLRVRPDSARRAHRNDFGRARLQGKQHTDGAFWTLGRVTSGERYGNGGRRKRHPGLGRRQCRGRHPRLSVRPGRYAGTDRLRGLRTCRGGGRAAGVRAGDGAVLRCPTCAGVTLRIAVTRHGCFVDMRGTEVLHFA